jgi:hypothetical protein
MVEQKQSAVQRIQVGVIGLVVVLLFVTLANMVLDRVSSGPQVAGTPGAAPTESGGEATPDEPLAELGVTPVAKDDSERVPSDTPKAARPPKSEPQR